MRYKSTCRQCNRLWTEPKKFEKHICVNCEYNPQRVFVIFNKQVKEFNCNDYYIVKYTEGIYIQRWDTHKRFYLVAGTVFYFQHEAQAALNAS